MKRFFVVVWLWSLVLALPFGARGEDANEETQLIGVLLSNHSLQEKDAACSRLKWIGTARSIPALEELLTVAPLSHSARYALESMPGPEAGNALRQVLPKTSGSNEVGIIQSLGARGETAAVPDLTKLLGDSDAEVAVAAADSLGHIGGPEAVQALQGAWNGSTAGAAHDAESDGLLACANRLLTSGDKGQALKIFQALYDREKSDDFRLAAFRGIILASEKRGIVLMMDAIAKPNGPKQGAALQLASKVGGSATTLALAKLLPNVPVAVQIALLQCLQQRGDRSAQPFVEIMLDSPNLDVRLAAISALGDLGDGKAAYRLARDAAAATGAEKAAAQQALIDLRRGPVTDSLLKPLNAVAPEVQVELMRALGDRGDASAAPKLLEMSRNENDSLRSAALQALALLAGRAQVAALVQLVVHATNDDARSEASDALGSVCQHIQSQKGRLDTSTLVQQARIAPLQARLALLAVCGGVNDPQVREVLRAGLRDPNERVRAAVIRALCDSQDEELLPDILKLACGSEGENFRMLGIRGCVRLITQEQAAPLPVSQKIDALKAILNTTSNPGEKRLILSGLASIADIQALDMAAAMLDDAAVKVEAVDAVVQIARAVSGQHPVEATAALKQVVAKNTDDTVRKSAQALLKKIKSGK
jgi:HEAT repeat protein